MEQIYWDLYYLLKEFNHISTTMIIFDSLHRKSLAPSKSMPQESNHDFKEKYPYIQAGTLEPRLIKDI